MARGSIRYEVDVDLSGIRAALVRAKTFRPALEKARIRLARANAENFTSNGLPVGGWAPRQSDYGWPIMRRTGQLFSQLSTLRGAPNFVGNNEASFGTNVEYAKFHQYGTMHMPKRQILFEPVGFTAEMGEDMLDWMLRGR